MTNAIREVDLGAGRRKRKTLLSLLAAAGTVLAVAVSVVAWTFAPARLSLPAVDVGSLPSASPPSGMSISALPTGAYETAAALAFRGGRWGDTRAFASTGVLVRHPRGDLLIDTGFGRNVEQHLQLIPSFQRSPHTVRVAIVDQLAATHTRRQDIAAIIPTHAHWDHISGVEDLPGVPVMVSPAGRSFIASKAEGTEVINSFHDVDYRLYTFEGGPYLAFPTSHDVYGDGAVVIVPAPGHTSDSVIVFVNLPSGKRYAFIGDLVWQEEGLTIPAEKPWLLRTLVGENNREVHTDLARIRDAVSRYPQITAVPAHDARAYRTIATYPDVTR